MSVFYGQESQASPERQESNCGLSAEERRLFHELLHVLKGLASAKGLPETDGSKIKDDKATVLQERNDQEAIGGEWRQERDKDKTKNVVRLKKLCDDHGQLAYRIQTSLNALGGGGRTAKALQRMDEAVREIRDLFVERHDKTFYFWFYNVKMKFDGYKKAALGAIDAFKELGVFNRNFFDAIEKIVKRLEAMTARFDVEYDFEEQRLMDMYMDSLFEPLIKDFELFLTELTNIAEKEIVTIRQSQNFTSQRYLNLTTVATFLSSVTATTLQTTVNDSDSPLWSAMNTLWFISLDFSMASAVYSLLVMTWRQSSVCKPDLSLPSTLKTWFLNGPMYTLIASVLAFSIGLSLFAFRALRQQVGLASAVVPTTLAGILASSIFLFSAWFLFEQWKAKYDEIRDTVQNKYLISTTLEKTITTARNCSGWVGKCVRRTAIASKTVTLSVFGRHKSSILDEKDGTNLEAGQHTISNRVQVPSEESQEVPPPEIHSADNVSNPQLETANPNETLPIPDKTPTALQDESETNGVVDDELPVEYRPFSDILQFSPDGQYLASAHSDIVVIYNVQKLFSIFSTIKDLEASQIEQVAWNPEFTLRPPGKERLEGDLLVRSSKGLSTWDIQHSPPNAHKMGHLKEVTGPVRWTSLDDAGIKGFVTTTKCSVRLFDEHCKEDPNLSIDVSEVPGTPELLRVKWIVDVIFYRKKYIFCLAHLAGFLDHLLVIDLVAKKVESHRRMAGGHKRMIFSPAAKRILFIGSVFGPEVAELPISSSEDGLNMIEYLMWLSVVSDQELVRAKQAVTFHGNKDKMIIGYSSGEVVALYEPHYEFEVLHIFTTRAEEAIPKDPVSFSVCPWPRSDPYLFAFADEHGSVTVWSVQSNKQLSDCKSAKAFAVEDRQDGRWRAPVISPGRYLVLPPPTVHDSAGQSSQEAR